MEKITDEYGVKISDMAFQNPFIGIIITDKDGVCLAVNNAHTRITGIKKDRFIGKKVQDSFRKKTISNSSTQIVLETGKEVNLHQTTSTGKSYEVKGVPVFDENGDILYTISYLLDVTEVNLFKKMIGNLQKDNKKVVDDLKTLLESGKNVGDTIYYGPKMQKIVDTAKQIAKSDATVLIKGPSGSGKELIADLIHNSSNRKDKPFTKINCAAIPAQLLESEFFGYEEGSFTGGVKNGRMGMFEATDGGTLLLDEIGEMSLNLQSKILRIIQDMEIRRIGSDKTTKVDVRIIASTNAPLEDLINAKKFREDLYFRLNVIEIDMPSLKERSEDIPVLIAYFINKFNNKYKLNKSLTEDAINYLSIQEYKGNIRELQNLIERIVLQSKNNIISSEDIVDIFYANANISESLIDSVSPKNSKDSLQEQVENYEKQLISKYINQYKKLDLVAHILQIDRSTLSRKMKKYGLPLL